MSNPWLDLAQQCLDDTHARLTDWEKGFLESYIEREWAEPTEKQQAVLERIAYKCGFETP